VLEEERGCCGKSSTDTVVMEEVLKAAAGVCERIGPLLWEWGGLISLKTRAPPWVVLYLLYDHEPLSNKVHGLFPRDITPYWHGLHDFILIGNI